MLKGFRANNAAASAIGILKICIVLCWVAWAILVSLTFGINIPTFHLDGAFQTASALYRLNSAQFPGKDFYPYLGIGPLVVLYPFFKLFGSTIAASTCTAQLVVLLTGALSAAVIWRLLWRPESSVTSIIAGCILFLAPIALAFCFSFSVPNWIVFAALPADSFRPYRVAAPYLVVVFYLLILRVQNEKQRYALAGLLTGSILLWSNDFAIPSAGLFALFVCGKDWLSREFKPRNIGIYAAASAVSWIVLITLLTLGHPIAFLKYNFIDVAQDQWWVFAPYGESERILSIWQVTKLFSRADYVPLILLPLSAAFAGWTRSIEYALVAWIGAVLFAGGALASYGGHLDVGYFGGFLVWGMLTLIVGVLRLAWWGFRKLTAYSSSAATISALNILLGGSMLLLAFTVKTFRSERSSAENDPNRFFVPELGGYLTSDWKNYVDLARQSKFTNVYEEYWGIWSAIRGIFPRWPVDSVIHALGSKRDIAIRGLQNADLVISTRYSMSSMWQPWNLSQNYWFYQDLLKEWSPSAFSPNTIIWMKNVNPRPFTDVESSFDSLGSKSITVSAPAAGFYEIDLQYSFSGSGRHLAMIRNNISFGIDANGYISIDPAATRVKFPVYIARPGPAVLDVKVIGNADYHFQIKSCAAKYIPPVNAQNRQINEEVLRTPSGN